MRAAVIALVLSLVTSVAAGQNCAASPGGGFSFTTSVAAGAGRRALYDVVVFQGGNCTGTPIGATQLGSVRRLAVTDNGTLIQILAPRTTHHDWSILRLINVAGDGLDVRVSLQNLPGTSVLSGSVRASFEGSAVRFAGRGGPVDVSFLALDALCGG